MSRSSFFEDAAADDALEARSVLFWEALLSHVDADRQGVRARAVLDFGCHRGGLLERIVWRWHPHTLVGVEPLAAARARARMRLQRAVAELVLVDPGGLSTVNLDSIDLLVSHEVLYLIEDLPSLFRQFAHVLAPGGSGYVVLGCHTENPLWPVWRAELAAQGQVTYNHAPLDVLRAGADAGLTTAVRPLRDAGWAYLDPTDAGFAFASVGALLDHQFRHKLLFRFGLPG